MKKCSIILIIILGLHLASCVKSDVTETKPVYAIMINNKTNNELLVFYQLNYPDTTLQKSRPDVSTIQQRSTGLIPSDKKWDDIIMQNKYQTLSLFFLAGGTFEKYSWDTVRSKYIILKRMEFPLDSLRNLNWTVQYPK